MKTPSPDKTQSMGPRSIHVGLVTPDLHSPLVDLLCEIHGYYNDGAIACREEAWEHLRTNLLSPSSPHRLAVAVSRSQKRVLGLAAFTPVYSLVDFSPTQRRHCQLKELYVAACARGQGVGQQLMCWLAQYALTHGWHRIDWPVRANNARGIAFYEGLGAHRVTERLSYRFSEPALRALVAMAATSPCADHDDA